MRILLVNPNISESVSDRIRRSASRAANRDTEFEVATARFGSAIISSDSENVIAAHATLDAFVEQARDREYDAGIIAAFTDPALDAVRDLCSFPVVGLAEAAMIAASAEGRRFAVLMPTSAMNPIIAALAARYGMIDRFAGMFTLPQGALDLTGDMDGVVPRFAELAEQARNAGADSLILGGALMSDLKEALQELVDAPVHEGVSAAVSLLQERRSGMNSLARNPGPVAGKLARGISPWLAGRLGLRLEDEPPA